MPNKRKPPKHTPKSPQPPAPLDWLWEAVRLSAEWMDYTHASAKELVADFFWADRNLHQLLDEMRWVGECMREPRLQGNAALAKSQLAFWAKAYRLLPYLVAVLKTAGSEIVKRANRNQVNKWFGLFMLGHLRGDLVTQDRALKNLQRLAHGIGRNNGWFPPDPIEGWTSPVNDAVRKQLEYFGDLDYQQTWESMTDNRFGVVSKAIKQRLLNEINRQYRNRLDCVPDDFFATIPEDRPDPEECLLADSLEGLLESDEELAPYEIGIYTAIIRVSQHPDLPAMRLSEVREAIIKGAAEARGISPQQARKDMKKVQSEYKHQQRIVRHLSMRKQLPVKSSARHRFFDEEEAVG